MHLEEVVEIREQFRQIGEYKIADALKEWLLTQNVYIEDGKRVVYSPIPIKDMLALEEKEKQAQNRFVSWLNGQFKQMGRPLITRAEFFN